jgi:tetratricopeptide (TPR) repeat protein
MNAPFFDLRTNRYRTLAAVGLLAVMALGLGGCDKLKARDQLNRGIQAYKAGQTDAAIENFKQAKELDPNLLMAQLYLATAYQASYIPGAPSEENVRMGRQALEEYESVLSKDPNNLDAIDRLGALLYNMAKMPFSPEKFLESKRYWQKHISLKADDPEPYYWIGLIDWELSYTSDVAMRAAYNRIPGNFKKQIKDDQPLPSDLREKLSAEQGQTIDEGIASLKKATELKPDYDDALVYLNLEYRQKADVVTDPAERDDLLKKADALVEQAKQVKQKKAAATPNN